MAEWSRRWTRNPLGFPRAGSNPANYGSLNLYPFFPSSLRQMGVCCRSDELNSSETRVPGGFGKLLKWRSAVDGDASLALWSHKWSTF